MPRAKPSQQTVEDEPVDQAQETDTLAGPVADGIPEPVAEALAKRMGWVPKEEWTRAPEDHVPASIFIEKTATQVEDLRARNRELQERSERSARAAADALEEERRHIREEALQTIRTADDPEERARAAERIAQSAGPPPETQAWLAKNPWFHTDPDAQAIVVRTVNDLAAQKRPISEQLAEAEKKVRRLFPEYFAGETEQRLSDVRRQAPNPPQVQQGSRAQGNGTPKEKGFADIPARDRQDFRTSLLKHFMARGQTQEQAETRYARSYWGTGVLPPEERGEERFPLTPQANIWAKRRGATRV